MAWFNIQSYAAPATSGTGANGAVGGGWTDIGAKWHLTNLAAGDNVLEIVEATSSNPWSNAQLMRKATSEAVLGSRVRLRFKQTSSPNGTSTSQTAAGSAPWVFLRYSGADASPSGYIVRPGSKWAIVNGALSGAQAVNNFASPYTPGNWYDLEVSATTSGSTTTITEKTWTVADHAASAFGAGTPLATGGGNVYSDTQFASPAAPVGLFFFSPGTGQVSQFSTDSDTAAATLTLTPPSTNGTAGSAISFSVVPAGAQNGGTVALADGGAGGTFTPSSVTLAAGLAATASFTYTPKAGVSGTVTISASLTDAVNTSTILNGTASISVTAAAIGATALIITPSTQSVVASATTGNYTVSANGSLASVTTVAFSDAGNQGTFTPASVTLAAGAGSAVAFTYTPAAPTLTQSNPLSASASGLTSGTASASVTAQASALAISPGSLTVAAGIASGLYTVAVAAGGLAAAKTIALSDGGAGGTLTPASLVLPAGTAPAAQSFTYTPAAGATGTKTLSASTTGLSAATTNAVIGSTSLIRPTNASVVASPYSWITGLSNPAAGDTSAVRAWNPGSYLRVAVTGTATIGIVFGASSTSANFIYQIDDGLPSPPIACPSNATYGVTLPDTGAHTVTFTLFSIPQSAGRWSGALAITINGFQITGGNAATVNRGTRNLLIYGDSIVEGIQSRDGSDGITTSHAYLIGEAFRRQGWEYSIKAAGSSGYTVAVAAASGGQPAAWTLGDDTNSSWNKVDGSGASGARLTTGAVGSTSERFVVQPDLIVDGWGTNDALQSVSDAAVQATASALWQRIRVAAPNTVITKVIPFGGHKRTAIQAAATALADPKLVVIDPKTDSRMTATGYCGNLLSGASSGQAIHPWSLGSASLASMLLRQIDAAHLPFLVARSYGSAS